MIVGGGLGASRFVPCALVVVELKITVYPLLVAMQSTATYPIGLLASVHLLQRPAIALDAIYKSKFLSIPLQFVSL